MQQMVDNAMDSSSGYGQQLSEAWHYMFGREPNYSAAYAAAIKAVESIALPMVEPNNKDSTLSKASRVMRINIGNSRSRRGKKTMFLAVSSNYL